MVAELVTIRHNNIIASTKQASNIMKKTFPNRTFKALGDRMDFTDALVKNGWRLLGSGAFASAYGHKDHDVVMKIGYIENNEAYLDFVAEMQKSPRHENLPRIYGITRFVNSTKVKREDRVDEYFVVIMEKLDESKKYRHGEDRKSKAFRKWYDGIKSKVLYHDDSDPLVALIKRAHERGAYHTIDMHYGNVMFRGDVPVITDPIC